MGEILDILADAADGIAGTIGTFVEDYAIDFDAFRVNGQVDVRPSLQLLAKWRAACGHLREPSAGVDGLRTPAQIGNVSPGARLRSRQRERRTTYRSRATTPGHRDSE